MSGEQTVFERDLPFPFLAESERFWLGPHRFCLGEEIAWNDKMIRYVIQAARGKRVLNLGCARQSLADYESRFWLHRALVASCREVIGLDESREGVEFLNQNGLAVVCASYSDFRFEQQFDVIVAEGLLHYISDFEVFIDCCRQNLTASGKVLLSGANPRNLLSLGMRGKPDIEQHSQGRRDPIGLLDLETRASTLGIAVEHVVYASRGGLSSWLPLPLPQRATHWFARLALKH